MAKRPGINRRIARLATLLIHGGQAEVLLEFAEALVNGSRPIKPKKATKDLARELIPHVTRAKEALAKAEAYLQACLPPAKAIRLSNNPRALHHEAEEGKAGDRGC